MVLLPLSDYTSCEQKCKLFAEPLLKFPSEHDKIEPMSRYGLRRKIVPDLTLRRAQEIVDRWVETQGGYWTSLAIMVQIAEETGEVARLINHLGGEKPKKAEEPEQDLGMELGDLIYAVICLANLHSIDLQASLEQVMAKYVARDDGRFLRQ